MTNSEHLQIDSLQAYFLGELPPLEAQRVAQLAAQDATLRQAWEEFQQTAEGLALAAALPPPAALRARILGTLNELAKEEAFDLAHPPRITRYADASRWQHAVRDLQPHGQLDGIPMYSLTDTPQLQQVLLWLEGTLVEKPHGEDEFIESFLILHGTCHCEFGEQHYDLGAGDFLEVPPHVPHSIRNTSPQGPLLAVVQRYKAA